MIAEDKIVQCNPKKSYDPQRFLDFESTPRMGKHLKLKDPLNFWSIFSAFKLTWNFRFETGNLDSSSHFKYKL